MVKYDVVRPTLLGLGIRAPLTHANAVAPSSTLELDSVVIGGKRRLGADNQACME